MVDHIMLTAADKRRVKGRECGNGVLIDHGDGWQSQLCHLARGSVRVKKGDRVERGTVVGQMGLSGATAFPHVHLNLRLNGRIVDPMTGRAPSSAAPASCPNPASARTGGLWSKSAVRHLPASYTALIAGGFAAGPVTSRTVMDGAVSPPQPGGALVVYAHFINLEKGDRIRLTLKGIAPTNAGFRVERTTDPMDGHKAQYTAFTGRRSHATGRYEGSISLLRNGTAIIEKRLEYQR